MTGVLANAAWVIVSHSIKPSSQQFIHLKFAQGYMPIKAKLKLINKIQQTKQIKNK